MSTPNASSPSSAASPQVLAPSTSSATNKPLAPNPPVLPTPSAFTHKEWVVPPRPKPGRKPAADCPPTKRKAQNREAQRAFRERRAARVGELEDLMKTSEEEKAKEQAQLRERIRQLERDMESYSRLLLSYQQRMQQMEATLQSETRLRENAENNLTLLRTGQKNGTNAVPLPRRSPRQKMQAVAENHVHEAQAVNIYEDISVGCGNCTQATRCECIEQAFDINDLATETADARHKRPHSPPTDEDNKRFRQEEPQSNEIDFTARFSSKKPPNLMTSASTSSNPRPAAVDEDPCGFCSDGTPCICAEMALEASKSEARSNLPRTETSNDNQTQPAASSSSNPCINGPGTCAQCLSDASSTLFCKSLAATRRDAARPMQPQPIIRAMEDTVASPPPTPTSHKEFSSSLFDNASDAQNSTASGPTLSCADAYETLSRHPAFEQASMELSTWMPQLATVPGGRERTAFEVEAASVMGVLRFFDRRFGKRGGQAGEE
ncbi:MAG: hypothetical protein LQ352_001830 [Teloschistes flavicans]|nr:MAG: hypothetical protein LQ352_001830 [Teloschistes flavicans]